MKFKTLMIKNNDQKLILKKKVSRDNFKNVEHNFYRTVTSSRFNNGTQELMSKTQAVDWAIFFSSARHRKFFLCSLKRIYPANTLIVLFNSPEMYQYTSVLHLYTSLVIYFSFNFFITELKIKSILYLNRANKHKNNMPFFQIFSINITKYLLN